jgi:uncharacterized membrane protein HdeD (DUF308 family)
LEFRALLGAFTLMLVGVLLIAYVYQVVSVPMILGIVLFADGLLVAVEGLVAKGDVSTKKYLMTWGSLATLVGVAVLALPYYGNSVFPFVLGVAMVLIGALALYGEAYGGRSK